MMMTINRRISGSEEIHWLEWARRNYIEGDPGLGLSIGCGVGALERDVVSRGICENMFGCDIAEGALEIARRAAEGLPITYGAVDLESEEVPGGPYDVAFAVATLHHLNRLGDAAARLRRSLKPGGLLLVVEFVGPSRFQWSPYQLELTGDIYSFLPWRYRMHWQSGGTVSRLCRPPLCSMVASDPSEAVRSAPSRRTSRFSKNVRSVARS
jgi:SAM-dependent methyltransferase